MYWCRDESIDTHTWWIFGLKVPTSGTRHPLNYYIVPMSRTARRLDWIAQSRTVLWSMQANLPAPIDAVQQMYLTEDNRGMWHLYYFGKRSGLLLGMMLSW